MLHNDVQSVLKCFWGPKASISFIHDTQKHFLKIFKKSKSATDIIFSRFMQLEAALVLEKPLFELEASNFLSLSIEAIIKPLKLELP